jgi:allantoinase
MRFNKIDILIKNGLIISHDGKVEGDLAIKGEKIFGLCVSGSIKAAEQIIDAKGKLIIPGIIDSHVHFNEPGRQEWEGFETGSKSAAAGGITTVIDMPLNSSPCTLNRKELRRKIEIGEKKSIIDFGLWGGATPNNLDTLEDLNKGGISGFKAFLSFSGIEEFKSINDGELIDVLQRIGNMHNLLGIHAENDQIIGYLTGCLQRAGRMDRKAFLESRPPISEREAVNRIVFLANNCNLGASLHILHNSLSDSLQEISRAKMLGLKITAETCPHYLTLTDEDFVKIGPAAKCAPPLRRAKEVAALWKSVKNGLVDVIGSDHSPCTVEEKEKGIDNIWEAWGGISGIQTMLCLIFSEGVIKRKLPVCSMVRMMSYNPARLFGLYPKKGVLQPGSDADLVILAPNKKWVLNKDDLYYKNKFSPFIGKNITGSVEMTLLRGRIIYEKGEVKAPSGFGKFLRRQQKKGN